MEDILIPLGLLLFIGLFAFALIHTGRKQRREKAGAFKDFANRHGLRYLEQVDGTAQGFARDFDGIGRFRSASLGAVIPKDVVSGTMKGMEVLLFRHMIRYGEGWAREWFVAGVSGSETMAERCAVQFCARKSDKSTMHLQDDVVKERQIGRFNVVVRAPGPSEAGVVLDDGVLEKLAELAGDLPFRPEIQVRGSRIVAYLADRNAEVDDVEALEALFEFTRKAAHVIDQADTA